MNNNNTIIGVIIVILVIIGGIYFFGNRVPSTDTTNPSTQNTNSTDGVSAKGRVVFTATDAAMDMSTISEVQMTISGVQIHNNTAGWVQVTNEPHTYNLLELDAKNESKIIADINTQAGSYDQIRLSVDKIIVKTKAGATKEAKLPSNELKINTNLVVKGESTSTVSFDFLADKSLHMTGNGEYIFAPVVHTETRSDTTVKINSDDTVTTNGGKVDTSVKVGMDIDGSIKLNFEIKSDEKLDITGGVIKVKSLINTGAKVY